MYTFLSNWFDLTRVRNGEVLIQTCELRIPRSPRMRGGRSTYSATLTGLTLQPRWAAISSGAAIAVVL